MKTTTDINSILFPNVEEGSRVLYNEKWYIYINGTWVLE